LLQVNSKEIKDKNAVIKICRKNQIVILCHKKAIIETIEVILMKIGPVKQ
jgi:hypothetical protein